MKTKYAAIEKILRQTAQARQDNKAAIAKLEASGKDYNAEAAAKFIAPKITEAKAGMAALTQASYEKVAGLLAELRQMAKEKHSKLNLENTAWQNALKLIELSGKDIDAETVQKINASFATDQPALRALRTIYKNQGVLYDGGISEMLYEPDAAFEKVGEWNYNAFMQQEGSLNDLARQISNVAAKEGIDFPTNADPAGATDVLRRAAGLPEK